jgi:O-antigen/teichoic acid export membrane protein
MTTIGRQVSRGVFWVGISTLTAQSLAFVTQLIVMRILPTSDFGMVALAALAINALQLFREFGFSAALIYRKDRVREAADTMFVLLILISLVLYVIAFVGARPIALFFYPDNLRIAQRQELIDILRILAFIMVLGSLGQVPFTMLSKVMDFRKRLLPDIVPEVIKDTTIIVLAIKGFGVWSLVYGQLVDISLTAIMSWIVAPLRPRPHFHMDIAREMFEYGKHIQASQILIFLITNLDNTFVGRLRGEGDLGVYSRAFNLSNLPSTQITRLVGQVMFPALSRVRDNMNDLRRVFLRAVKYTSLVSIPMGVGIFVFSPPFMDILYGAKWHAAIVPMQLLVIYGGLRAIAGNMGEVFKAGGKPQWLLGIAAWRLATMLILLYPVTVRYGIIGVSVLSALVAIADFVISTFLVNRVARTSFADFGRILAPLFAMSVAAVLVAEIVFRLAYSYYPPLALLLAGLTMITAYIILVLALDGEVRQRMVMLVGEVPIGSRMLRRAGIRPQIASPLDQP